MSKDPNNPQGKKDFTGIMGEQLNQSVSNRFRELMTPDAPLAPKTVSGANFKLLVDALDKTTEGKGILSVYVANANKGMSLSRPFNKLPLEFMETFDKYFEKVTIQKSLDSLMVDIGTIVLAWWHPLNPTKRAMASSNIKMAVVMEMIARKTKSDTMTNVLNKVGGTFNYKLKNYVDMDILETILKAVKDAK